MDNHPRQCCLSSAANDHENENVVIVSHGFTIRILLMHYFNLTVDQFHQLKNPENCEALILERDENHIISFKAKFLPNIEDY